MKEYLEVVNLTPSQKECIRKGIEGDIEPLAECIERLYAFILKLNTKYKGRNERWRQGMLNHYQTVIARLYFFYVRIQYQLNKDKKNADTKSNRGKAKSRNSSKLHKMAHGKRGQQKNSGKTRKG